MLFQRRRLLQEPLRNNCNRINVILNDAMLPKQRRKPRSKWIHIRVNEKPGSTLCHIDSYRWLINETAQIDQCIDVMMSLRDSRLQARDGNHARIDTYTSHRSSSWREPYAFSQPP